MYIGWKGGIAYGRGVGRVRMAALGDAVNGPGTEEGYFGIAIAGTGRDDIASKLEIKAGWSVSTVFNTLNITHIAA